MTSDEKRIFFQCLFAVAWVDGELGENEEGMLSTLFAHVELDETARGTVRGWFQKAPPEPEWAALSQSPTMRRELVEQVFFLAASDRVVNEEEMSFLERLRERLGMPGDEFQDILVSVERKLAH